MHEYTEQDFAQAVEKAVNGLREWIQWCREHQAYCRDLIAAKHPELANELNELAAFFS